MSELQAANAARMAAVISSGKHSDAMVGNPTDSVLNAGTGISQENQSGLLGGGEGMGSNVTEGTMGAVSPPIQVFSKNGLFSDLGAQMDALGQIPTKQMGENSFMSNVNTGPVLPDVQDPGITMRATAVAADISALQNAQMQR